MLGAESWGFLYRKNIYRAISSGPTPKVMFWLRGFRQCETEASAIQLGGTLSQTRLSEIIQFNYSKQNQVFQMPWDLWLQRNIHSISPAANSCKHFLVVPRKKEGRSQHLRKGLEFHPAFSEAVLPPSPMPSVPGVAWAESKPKQINCGLSSSKTSLKKTLDCGVF